MDLPGKKKEINFLLEELAKDSKRSFIKDRSNKDELLEETIDTLVNWLNDIWSLVYEYNVNFAQAHACLLFVADVLDQINDTHDGYADMQVICFTFAIFLIILLDINVRYWTWLWMSRSRRNPERS